jgi:hypothetical protein
MIPNDSTSKAERVLLFGPKTTNLPSVVTSKTSPPSASRMKRCSLVTLKVIPVGALIEPWPKLGLVVGIEVRSKLPITLRGESDKAIREKQKVIISIVKRDRCLISRLLIEGKVFSAAAASILRGI